MQVFVTDCRERQSRGAAGGGAIGCDGGGAVCGGGNGIAYLILKEVRLSAQSAAALAQASFARPVP